MVKAISACPLLSNNCFKNFIALIVITFLTQVILIGSYERMERQDNLLDHCPFKTSNALGK